MDCLQIPYPYGQQLVMLDKLRPTTPVQLPEELQQIHTPLQPQAWQQALAGYPDKSWTEFLLKGITQGFRIGFNWEKHRHKLRPNHRNLRSAEDNPEVVRQYLAKETAEGRISKVASGTRPTWVHCSPIGVIPKKNRPNKWRIIIDLSALQGGSINGGIEKELCSLSYISVDQVASCVLMLGPGALMAKMDLKHAFRTIPVHPDDCRLFGVYTGRVTPTSTMYFLLAYAQPL